MESPADLSVSLSSLSSHSTPNSKRTKFFTGRVMQYCSRLSKEVVDAPSPAVFEARVDGTLSNLL